MLTLCYLYVNVSLTLRIVLIQLTDVLPDNVKFQIHYRSRLNLVEIRTLVGIGNNGYLKTVIF